jgi:hypothetical protein
MPYFAAFLSSVFGGLFAFLLKHFTHRVAVALTLTAAVLSATMAFYLILQSLMSGIMLSISNEYLLMVFWTIFPDNGSIYITACFSADIAAFVYRHKLQLMRTIAGI